MKIDDVLVEIKNSYLKLLGKNLVGIYVHGSYAFGCFNDKQSDIDLIVVVDEPLDDQTKEKLLNATKNLSKCTNHEGIELSVVLKKYCQYFQYPTPYEQHISKTNHKITAGLDFDLATHFMIINKVGIVLYGQPIIEVFSKVPPKYFYDSLLRDVGNAKKLMADDPIYFILNLCRTLAYKKDDLILSKHQGGIWAQKNLPEKYHDLIKQAIDAYASDVTTFDVDHILASDFANYVLAKLN